MKPALSHRVRKEKHALMLCQHIRKPVKTRRGCSCQMIEVLGSPILRLHSFLNFCDWQIDSFCSAGVYKPTQDPEGLQLKTLEALGSSIFWVVLRDSGSPCSITVCRQCFLPPSPLCGQGSGGADGCRAQSSAPCPGSALGCSLALRSTGRR